MEAKFKKELEHFQGMVNYLKHYSSQLTQVTEPLTELLRKDILWCWESKHQEAFKTIKEELTKTPVLAYFNPKADHIIQVDGSMKGSGAIPLQKGKPVIYVSRALTTGKIGYLDIKREHLRILFGFYRLHHYVLAAGLRYKPITILSSQSGRSH